MHARADAEVAAGVSVVAGLEVTVATVEAGVARAVVVKLVVVATTSSRAGLIPAPVVCKAHRGKHWEEDWEQNEGGRG